ncbi:MAG: MxaS protein [Burkholderiaceae bacterium]|nr:MxaS protein [Burkholderiaceae bacterium]
MREVHYRLPGLAAGALPGAHRSGRGEGGFEYRGPLPLARARDLRRLDLRSSLRDPFGQWTVRQYSQRLSVPVLLVADVSASMAFDGRPPRQEVLADFTESLAASAWRNGDGFGFVACDEQVRQDLLLPPGRQRGAGAALAARLRGLVLSGRSSQGLREAWRWLPQRRSLVFLVSDFHLPEAELRAVLASLALHALVPVVLWQAQEAGPEARRGLLDLVDPETGRRQWLWWRPALRQQMIERQQGLRERLRLLFAGQRLRPLFIEGAFDADAVTRHFLS